MNRLMQCLALAGSIGMLGGCAGYQAAEPESLVLAQIADVATGAYETRPVVLDVEGAPTILHLTKKGRVVVHSQGKTLPIDASARVKEGAGFLQFHQQGNNLQATWWSHQDGKNIYMASSRDGGKTFEPVTMVNDDHGVLPPYSLVSFGADVLGMAYQDERQPNYQAYFNRSVDIGRTWPRPDMRLDTPPDGGRSSEVHEPVVVQSGQSWISAWTETGRENGLPSYRIVTRHSEDGGTTWTSQQTIFKSDRHLSAFVLRSYGDTIIGVADELSRGVRLMRSEDRGVTWLVSEPIAESDGGNNSGIEFEKTASSVVALWNRDETDKKSRIMRGVFDLETSKWNGPAVIHDLKDYSNTRSMLPTIKSDALGRVISAWVDYRDIRANIYVSYSLDNGKTWTTPEPVEKPGLTALGWPALTRLKGELVLSYQAYPNDVLTEGTFTVRKLPFDKAGKMLVGLAKSIPLAENARKERLAERVKLLWDSRVKGDYSTSYDIFDFAYKAVTPKKRYVENAGVINYLQYSIESISIKGNEASVDMKVKYEVPPTILPQTGKPITVPPFDSDTPTRWVWVADDWYIVYAPSFDPPVLKY